MKALQGRTDTLEIWTNGSITPHEAISEGSEILTSLFSPLRQIDFKSKESEDKSSEAKVNQILIEELQLICKSLQLFEKSSNTLCR